MSDQISQRNEIRGARVKVRENGFTKLSLDTTEQEVIADVVFIHGLGGHPENTWTYTGDEQLSHQGNSQGNKPWCLSQLKTFRRKRSKQSAATGEKLQTDRVGCFWPADLLPRDFRNIRILTYGYDSNITHFIRGANKMTISQHGRTLLERLTDERVECNARPIIFIAHSLGGLLVKDVIIESKKYDKLAPQRMIFSSCRAVMFFATPHLGADIAAWGKLLTNLVKALGVSTYDGVLEQLNPDSEKLEGLGREFNDILNAQIPVVERIKIYSFQEGKGLAGVNLLDGLVVSSNSSWFNRRDIERSYVVEENHMNMCRFKGDDDSNYTAFKRGLQAYLTEIMRENRDRSKSMLAGHLVSNTRPSGMLHVQTPIPESHDDTVKINDPPLNPTVNNVIFNEHHPLPQNLLDTVDARRNLNAHMQPVAPSKKYISVLGLPELTYQEPFLEPSSPTDQITTDFEWFFGNPDYVTWFQGTSSRILWLRSKSRSESHSIFSCLLEQLLHRGLNDRSEKTIYFPHSPSLSSKPVERISYQAIDIVRTLISQLFYDGEDRLEHAMNHYPILEMSKDSSYTFKSERLVWKSFVKVLFYALTAVPGTHVNVVVDGIDELGTEKYKFLENLLDLDSKLQNIQESEGIVVKIFFTSGLINISTPMNDLERSLAKIPTIEKDKELKGCLQSLRIIDFSVGRERIPQGARETGKWLWTDDSYTKWQKNESSSLLLIRGKPGSGKSTLAKRILEAITPQGQEPNRASENVLIAYFFYSFRGGKSETSHKIMLQSILYQLLNQEHRLYYLFREAYRRLISGKTEWDIQDLLRIVNSLPNADIEQNIYIVLDAMDESDKDEWRCQILDTMANLCSCKSKCIIKGLVATRPLPNSELETRSKRREFQFTLILEHKNHEDIEKLVDRKLEEINNDLASDDDFTMETTVFSSLKEHIMGHARGVFLWVSLVLKELEKVVAKGFSENNLEELDIVLPTEVMELYKRMVECLVDDEKDVNEAKKFLMWVSFALRSLTLDELRDAVAVLSIRESQEFKYGQDYLKSRRINLLERLIRFTCGDFLDIRKPFVQLLHETVREFLLRKDNIAGSFRIDRETSNTTIASVCTRYLMLSFSQRIFEEYHINTAKVSSWNSQDYMRFVKLLNDRPLLAYAVKSLPKHVELANDACVSKEYDSFVSEAAGYECSRYFLAESLAPSTQPKEVAQFRIKALIAAAKGDFINTIKTLVTVGTDVNGTDETTGISPLLAASAKGCRNAASLLLELNADCNAKDTYGETALHKASAYGQEQLVSLLLERGAYEEAENIDNERPLHFAAVHGHLEVARQLLKSVAYPWYSDRYGGTPLHRAAANGYLETTRLLLNSGSIPHNKVMMRKVAKYGGTPLHRAVDNNHEAVVKLLLEEGAPVNEQSGYGGSVLHRAAANGQESIMRLLLEHTIHLDRPDHYGLTPLQWALENGNETLVKLLQDKIDACGDSGNGHKVDNSQNEIESWAVALKQSEIFH